MILLWRPTQERLDALLWEMGDAPYTYPDVGATRDGLTPAGYRGVNARGRLGQGEDVFRRAAEAVLRWQVQRGAGMTVTAETAMAEPGRVLLSTMPAGPLHVVIPCRVVYVVDEPDRIGFGYGTLPGHPASGEEAFVVERDGDTVYLRVTAFSRPAGLVERLGAPATRAFQRLVTDRYLIGLRRHLRDR